MFRGRVASIAPSSLTANQTGSQSSGQQGGVVRFEVKVAVTTPDPRLRPGMSGTVRVATSHTPEALMVPARACFTKGGRTVAYVKRFWSYEERPIEVSRRSKTEVVVARGLSAGDKIAMVDPTLAAEERRP